MKRRKKVANSRWNISQADPSVALQTRDAKWEARTETGFVCCSRCFAKDCFRFSSRDPPNTKTDAVFLRCTSKPLADAQSQESASEKDDTQVSLSPYQTKGLEIGQLERSEPRPKFVDLSKSRLQSAISNL